ncbi:MAG: sensor histidine kinase [Solirubrobacteraceae bacterium]
MDLAITTMAVGGSLLFLAHGGAGALRTGSRLDVAGGLLVAGAGLPLLAWRRAPLGVFVSLAGASTLTAGLGYSLSVPLPATAGLYLLAASRDEASPWTIGTTIVVGGLLAAYLATTAAANGAFPGLEILHTCLAWAVAWFAGERTRLRREHIAELEQRAIRAEREAERERRLAVIEERARIARDLHDSAGHAINVIGVRAGAARLRYQQEPDRAPVALEAIEQLARQTVQEIDQLVGALREDSSTDRIVDAPPGIASLRTLIAQHTSNGEKVSFATTGAPRPVSSSVDQATFRILQEALTNAARHGNGTVQVELAFAENGLELTVCNPVPTGRRPGPGGGHGLIGMRERAGLLGGRLVAERLNGSFRVHAELPHQSLRP